MANGLSPEEIEWLREGYRLFAAGDPAFMDNYTDDARFSFPPTLPEGGVYEGPFAALAFWSAVAERFAEPHPEPEEMLRVGDRVIVIGTFRARARRSGKPVEQRFVHVMRAGPEGKTLIDRKVASFELFIDTAAVLQALE